MNTLFISIVTLGLATVLWMPGTPAAPTQSDGDAPAVFDTVVHADSAINWEQMSKAERKDYMKHVVLPKMKPILEAFGTKEFKKVGCGTCHGMGARDGQFKMPNPELTKLPNSREGFEKLNKEKPHWMEFMAKTMKPSMASLLNIPMFNPKTGKGFGCGNCHTSQE